MKSDASSIADVASAMAGLGGYDKMKTFVIKNKTLEQVGSKIKLFECTDYGYNYRLGAVINVHYEYQGRAMSCICVYDVNHSGTGATGGVGFRMDDPQLASYGPTFAPAIECYQHNASAPGDYKDICGGVNFGPTTNKSYWTLKDCTITLFYNDFSNVQVMDDVTAWTTRDTSGSGWRYCGGSNITFGARQVPSCTTANNGKVLKVVNGVATWASA